MMKLGDLVQHIDDLRTQHLMQNFGVVVGFGYSGPAAYQQQPSEDYVQILFNDNQTIECWPSDEVKVLSSGGW